MWKIKFNYTNTPLQPLLLNHLRTSVVSTKEAKFDEGYQERQLAHPSTIL